MSERGRHQVARDRDALAIASSTLEWDGDALTYHLDERAAPLPRPVRGTVRVHPTALGGAAWALDEHGRHRWRPIAPRARVEVDLAHPGLRWSGDAYLDHNAGTEPLEAGFRHWSWSRAHLPHGETAVVYEGTRADRGRFGLTLRIAADGTAHEAEPPPPARLPATPIFHMPRATRGTAARVVRTWEDAPFYARSAITAELFGQSAPGVHESLSLTRFVNPLVQALLPFRMPRVLT